MKIIKPEVKEILLAEPGKRIEYSGRTCYHSDSNINDTSYIKFIQNIVKSGHGSVLEHERLTVKVDSSISFPYLMGIDQSDHMKYFNISLIDKDIYISANIRTWYKSTKNQKEDCGYYNILKEVYPFIFTEEKNGNFKQFIKLVSIKEIPEEIREMHDNHTFEIICSRSCSHQLVRHRTLSVSQESQRYVNFSSEKFGHSINFILPILEESDYDKADAYELEEKLKSIFTKSENDYFSLIDAGFKPEMARCVLPNSSATKIVLSGTTNDWRKFINLRSDLHAQKEIRTISDCIKGILRV